MRPLPALRSRTVVLPQANIDTDQIIPARFLTTTQRAGLGAHAFADWRFDAEGRLRPDFPLNQVDLAEHRILVAGENFGCGSSREHAPWALLELGLQAVVSTEIADIFEANALKNGLLAIEIGPETHGWLVDHPGVEIEIDVAGCRLALPSGRVASFPLEPFARRCLLDGVDQLGFLLSRQAEIARYEARRGS